MTIRKGIPRQGKHRNEPLRDKMSRSPGSVPTLEHAAGMGQEAFSGRTAKEVLCGQLGAEKSLIYKALQAQNRGRQ